mmetsp:Transcript_13606/g.27001  ORF Transcript_13606/g.27001 Transcript_13606/m.27001 type:complete len:212 (-) Transcript_13606:706-1341(-)
MRSRQLIQRTIKDKHTHALNHEAIERMNSKRGALLSIASFLFRPSHSLTHSLTHRRSPSPTACQPSASLRQKAKAPDPCGFESKVLLGRRTPSPYFAPLVGEDLVLAHLGDHHPVRGCPGNADAEPLGLLNVFGVPYVNAIAVWLAWPVHEVRRPHTHHALKRFLNAREVALPLSPLCLKLPDLVGAVPSDVVGVVGIDGLTRETDTRIRL